MFENGQGNLAGAPWGGGVGDVNPVNTIFYTPPASYSLTVTGESGGTSWSSVVNVVVTVDGASRTCEFRGMHQATAVDVAPL